MKLRFTQRAVRDLAEIADYIKAENPQAALWVRAAILNAVETLVRFPRLGRRQGMESVRKFVTARYGYAVYCATDEAAGEVVILTIRHPARKPVNAPGSS